MFRSICTTKNISVKRWETGNRSRGAGKYNRSRKKINKEEIRIAHRMTEINAIVRIDEGFAATHGELLSRFPPNNAELEFNDCAEVVG